MGKNFRIKPSVVKNSSGAGINPTQAPLNQKIAFNFHYLNECGSKFCYSNKDKEYILMILEKLKQFSEFTRQRLSTDSGLCDMIRHHRIDFTDKRVSEKGFNLKEVPGAEDNAYQFAFSKAKGRIHGFWEGSMFHVVWIDPEHDLYS